MLVSFIVIGIFMSAGSSFLARESTLVMMGFSVLSLPGAIIVVWIWEGSEYLNNQGDRGFILAYLANIVLVPLAMMGLAVIFLAIVEHFSLPGWLEGVLLLTWFGPIVATIFYWVAAPVVAVHGYITPTGDDFNPIRHEPSDSTIATLILMGVIIGGLMWWANIRFYKMLVKK